MRLLMLIKIWCFLRMMVSLVPSQSRKIDDQVRREGYDDARDTWRGGIGVGFIVGIRHLALHFGDLDSPGIKAFLIVDTRDNHTRIHAFNFFNLIRSAVLPCTL